MLSGCYLKSVHPLITKEQATLQKNLDGVYENANQRWTFASDPEKAADLLKYWNNESIEFTPDEGDKFTTSWDGYLVLFEDRQSKSAPPILFVGLTGEINGNQYLNLKLLDIEVESFISSFQFRVNTFSKVNVDSDTLKLEFFESKWIKNQILSNRVRIKHEVATNDIDGTREVLITASNKELRKFVEKYGDTEEAYEDPINLKRVTNGIQ